MAAFLCMMIGLFIGVRCHVELGAVGNYLHNKYEKYEPYIIYGIIMAMLCHWLGWMGFAIGAGAAFLATSEHNNVVAAMWARFARKNEKPVVEEPKE